MQDTIKYIEDEAKFDLAGGRLVSRSACPRALLLSAEGYVYAIVLTPTFKIE